MVSGIPVVISGNGLGLPVKPVASDAPLMTVAENGFGSPIVISDLGAPFVVDGYTPIDFGFVPMDLLAEAEGQWVGYSDGGVTRPQPAFGTIDPQPTAVTNLLAFYDDTNSGVFLAVFEGDYESELAGLQVSIGGFVMPSFEIELISGNTWVRLSGLPGDLEDGVLYQVEFGFNL